MKLQQNQNFIDVRLETYGQHNIELKRLMTAILSTRRNSRRFFLGNLSFLAYAIISVTVDNEDDTFSKFGMSQQPIKRRVRIVYES